MGLLHKGIPRLVESFLLKMPRYVKYVFSSKQKKKKFFDVAFNISPLKLNEFVCKIMVVVLQSEITDLYFYENYILIYLLKG